MVLFSAEKKVNIHSTEGLWMLPDADLELSVVLKFEQEDPLGLELDVIPQPSYPSPNYESEVSEAVSALEHYLSPRGEENMDFSGRAISEGSECLESVAFDDLLDGNYSVPAMQDNIEADLQRFLYENDSSNDSVSLVSINVAHSDEEDSAVDVTSPTATESTFSGKVESFTKCEPEELKSDARILKDNDNSRVIILKQKNGTNKVLNVVPVKSSELPKFSAQPPTNCITVTKRAMSPPRRSARTITCHRPGLPTRKSTSPTPSQISMYSHDDIPKESESVDDKSRRNAIQAKLNREKKKAYMSTLEGQVCELTKENNHLKTQTTKLVHEKDSLAEEVEYLRSVIANQSSLSRLLGNITDVKSVSLSTSFMNDRKRKPSEEDHDYVRPAKSSKSSHRYQKSSQKSAGVCLHVENDNVSLEFCSSCARMAKEASNEE